MKPADRAKLTASLRDHVAKVAEDLRAQMREPGAVRQSARKLHADEQVGEDFDVWTDLLARRGAVLWVLKSVYIRVLEDRGLLAPGRILDIESQQLFERLAPNLGETAFLRWVYRDLASQRGGLPELFSAQPAEIAWPSDGLARELLTFWRHRDPDTGAQWSFAEETFEGELMGDLYQELDPVVKDRFALCQTPDFVRAFILDRTLAPAIETFGAAEVRLLDPACGSGHFLIDGLKRLVAATADNHPDWEKKNLVTHCLERVVGIDLNDYACALARARLVMTAAELAGVGTLADAAQFHPHVYWADGLEQVEKGKDTRGQQLDLLDPRKNEEFRASLTRPEVRAALASVLKPKFHVVVANPPYDLEKDDHRKAYHRESVGKRRRYLSATGRYSLGAPFTERAIQLCTRSGFFGLITADNFMTRASGKAFIEQVLAAVDLSLIAQTSGAILATSGFETTTVMLFGRAQEPSKEPVAVVAARKGDTERSLDPSTGPVWQSILTGWKEPGFENEYVIVASVDRGVISRYPWSFGSQTATDLKARIERHAEGRIGAVVESIGFASFTGTDEAFLQPRTSAPGTYLEETILRPVVAGEVVRDWVIAPTEIAIAPYGADAAPITDQPTSRWRRFLWPFRTTALNVVSFGGKTRRDNGDVWWHWYRWVQGKYNRPLSITYAAIATHNHFALERGSGVFKQTAPVIKLDAGASLEQHLFLLGVLNSSALTFWFRRTLHKVGGRSAGTKRQSEEWAQRRDFAAKLVERAPLPKKHRDRVIRLASKLDQLGRDIAALDLHSLLHGKWEPQELSRLIEQTIRERADKRRWMIAYQEELDWTVYAAFGLVPDALLSPMDEIEPLESAHRPFAIRLARDVAAGLVQTYWFDALQVRPCADVPDNYPAAVQQALMRRLSEINREPPLALLESPASKRKWEPDDITGELAEACRNWLANAAARALGTRHHPIPIGRVAAAVQDDHAFQAVAALHTQRKDVDIDRIVADVLCMDSVPSHPFHVYTESGLEKRAVWEEVWRLQRLEDCGEGVEEVVVPADYSQGSRGKSTDFRRNEYWKLRGKLDVPRERFIAFTEVPGRDGADTLYGWAGWTPLQRLKAILAIDEELEDGGVPLGDRIALLDSAWRLLPDVAREDPAAASRLKAELQALIGTDGPSQEMLDDWRERFPPPGTRTRSKRKAKK